MYKHILRTSVSVSNNTYSYETSEGFVCFRLQIELVRPPIVHHAVMLSYLAQYTCIQRYFMAGTGMK